jgi:aminopeptidase
VALVGTDSPVYKSGRVFEEILYDENAACHIAIGLAYKNCLEAFETLGKEELTAIGCNESLVHTDMMVSNNEVSVEAELYSGERMWLIRDGAWEVGF